MDKRYQVFVSSTYADLRDERARVSQTLLEMDCIPSGMELFPAVDEEQWTFIKRVIDDCDYYLLIIGGRYGSTTPEGVSYTEKEYDYAVEKDLRIIALLHAEPAKLSAERSELDPALRERLQAFRHKVSEGRLVKSWRSAEELPGLVATSLLKTMKAYPAVGWVRADTAERQALLERLDELRKANEELQRALESQRSQPPTEIADLASLDEAILLQGVGFTGNTAAAWKVQLSWRSLFALLAPHIQHQPSDARMRDVVAQVGRTESDARFVSSPRVDGKVFHTVRLQLLAHGLIKTPYSGTKGGGAALFWNLTAKGEALMMEEGTVRVKAASPAGDATSD